MGRPDPIPASTAIARPTGTAAARKARNSDGPVRARARPVRAKMPAPIDCPISMPTRCGRVIERFRLSRGEKVPVGSPGRTLTASDLSAHVWFSLPHTAARYRNCPPLSSAVVQRVDRHGRAR